MLQQQFQSCIEACQACATACDYCASQCLKEYDVSSMARCIALDVDCADACRLAATFMARGSGIAIDVCALCADICEACGDECSRHAMAHCQDCARACRHCAQECRSMESVQPGRQADKDIGTVPH